MPTRRRDVDGDFQVLPLRRVGDVTGAPGQDHVLDREGEDGAVVLRQVAEDAGPPPGGEGALLLSHDAYLAPLELEQASQNAHEGRFSAAVLAEQDGELLRWDLQGDLVEYRPPLVGEGEPVDRYRRR